MKKLLGILVLGLLLHGCATTTYQSEVTMWQRYLSLQEPYKAYAKILDWKGRYIFDKLFKADFNSVDNAIAWIYQSEWCAKGCIITHIGNNKISLERQREIEGEREKKEEDTDKEKENEKRKDKEK